MMFKTKKAISLLAAAGMALASTAVNAATTAYTNGDIFLGFRQTGNSNSLLINIGQAGGYRDGTTTGALSLGNLGADLNAWYGGTGWASDATVFWGVVGTIQSSINGDTASTLYASKPESVFGTPETGYARANVTTQNIARSNIVSMSSAYAGQTSTANSNVALLQSNSATNSWASWNPGGQSFSYFSGMEGNFGSGVASAALDLFRMPTGTGTGTYEGTFTIDNSGVVSFGTSAPGAVPEPSRVSFAGMGRGALLLRRRRPAVAV
jgi:hypothetical protein